MTSGLKLNSMQNLFTYLTHAKKILNPMFFLKELFIFLFVMLCFNHELCILSPKADRDQCLVSLLFNLIKQPQYDASCSHSCATTIMPLSVTRKVEKSFRKYRITLPGVGKRQTTLDFNDHKS